jgi:hypothetical protein
MTSMRILQLNTMILHDERKKFLFFFKILVKGQDQKRFDRRILYRWRYSCSLLWLWIDLHSVFTNVIYRHYCTVLHKPGWHLVFSLRHHWSAATVNPRYNGHIRFQRFCRYNESAVVTSYRHYEVSQIGAIIF